MSESSRAVLDASASNEAAYQKLISDLRVIWRAPEFETQKENVRRHWKIGKRLNEYLPSPAPKFETHKLFIRLRGDLGRSRNYFLHTRTFARLYPEGPPDIDLSWSHYITAISVRDDSKRKEILEKAFTEHWDKRRLDREIRGQLEGRKEVIVPLLETMPGIPGTYRIIKHGDHLAYDLGFSIYRDLLPEEREKFNEGDIVNCQPQASSHKPESQACSLQPEASAADLFTYRARSVKVIDGDTVIADLDLGFGMSTVRRMRLRGIDAPELMTEAGPKAKAALEKWLSRESSGLSHERKAVSDGSPLKTQDILIHAEKTDKYNRSLADIWTAETYTNRKLLDDGLAVAMQE